MTESLPDSGDTNRSRIVITYCVRCGWLLRAAWMAQELLTSFHGDVSEVALRPGPSGSFRIDAGDSTIWNRETDGGFPEIAVLKQRVRDVVAPARDLGHTDRSTLTSGDDD
ncbi:SelT/SelW/SelH family protein [Hoyosella altamirensis]|uniref:Selenoprotein W-related protein n=1 Tax=Hoyosella altamirensis TaxID=616997 RepID=A0A839RPP2_9ACTN|nr:SelT/SelW/SelH family protein [Hoyosella altamirensis]MBB3037996.1 selenoprotein W-related protein [Hoyosella altamirensis]